MKRPPPTRRAPGALTLLALACSVFVPGLAAGADADRPVLMAQATLPPAMPTLPTMPGTPTMPMNMPMQGATPSAETGGTRGIFLAMFAQQIIPGLASGLETWFKNKLNGPAPAAGAAAMPMPMSSGLIPGSMGGGMPSMPQSMSSMPQSMSSMPQSMPGMPPPMETQGMPGGMPGQMPMSSMPSMAPSGMPAMSAAPSMPGMQASPGTPAMQAIPGANDMQAGMAFQVVLVGRDGSRVLVDPAKRGFVTGDRIEVSYRTNLPGIVEVYNIDSTGKEELIDQQMLAAAQLVTLGPYEFVNVKGSETLRVSLKPCVSSAGGAASRGMVRAQVRPELAAALLTCDDPALKKQKTAARGITKVAVEGGTHFALDPVSRSEIESGQIAAREVSIQFTHR